MLHFDIRTIPHRQQRYNTVGDYQTSDNGNVYFTISEMANWRYEFLVALHEQIEKMLCFHRDISEARIDAFDIKYEENRKEGDLSEPGNDPSAPYHNEHMLATIIEKLVANELGVDWDEYDKTVSSL